MALAGNVCDPPGPSGTRRVLVPPDNAPLDGSVALASLEVMPTVCVLLTRFQSASTDRTVALNAVPALWELGVPVLPAAVPGAAVSPGPKNCSFTNAPAFTSVDQLALPHLAYYLVSRALIVHIPPDFSMAAKIMLS